MKDDQRGWAGVIGRGMTMQNPVKYINTFCLHLNLGKEAHVI